MRKRFGNALLGTIMCSSLLLMSCGGGGGGSATTPSPRVNVSRTQVDFGDAILDNPSEQQITIKNVGTSTLNIGQIAQANPLAQPFSIISDNCSAHALAANQTCTFGVRFSSTVQGQGFNDSFDIPTNDPTFGSVTVNVRGNVEGIRISINQATLACPNIDLLIAVADKNGNPITGLQLDNFDLFVDNVLTAKQLFPILSPIPVSVALVLDSSDTVTPFRDNVIAASHGFVDLMNPDDRGAVIKFAKSIELKQTFTSNIAALQTAIDNNYTGSIFATVLYDALWSAVDLTSSQPNNRAIVVISDGKDEDPAKPGGVGSVKTLAEVISHAKQAEVTIFAIGVGNPISTDVMVRLATETGGQYFAAPNSSQLAAIYQAIRDILDGQYMIRFVSPSTGGGSITVNVVVDTVIDAVVLRGDASRQVQACP